ncbi:MAG: 30S ribosomal protein S1 [Candidatus Eisenbacteria bacterium]|uniref:Small ribosomal subunit protein bS1 n=1 Tax=Eiseniibacteriota bacterium TaxID=2212470 RepID=A0A538TTM5_UNCEI|nr:MAG: 30S ribosomal protein S1 [Candidatus Eisenbacteria bacterium]
MVRRHEEDVDVKDESAEDAEVETKPRKRKPQTRLIHEEGGDEGTVTAVGTQELDPDEDSAELMGQWLQLYEDSLKDLEEGEIVRGRVLKIDDKEVTVDVGFKSEGVIPVEEFPDLEGVKVGDEIEVFLEKTENQDGLVVLSKQRADFVKVWDRVKTAADQGQLVEGKLVRKIKGGVVVDLYGVEAFLPGSQIALRQVQNVDSLIGQGMEFKIIKLNKRRRNIVVSRRAVLEEHRAKQKSEIIQELAKDQIREGVVKNITDFGAFVDLGGIDGLLHITDMSWGRVSHPSELVSIGEKVKVKVLSFDPEKERISLGMKQLTPYPWEDVDKRYQVAQKVKGKVVSITDYGAFVELEKGIEGLIHISEMSWTRHVRHPSKVVAIGDQIEAVILKIDKENEKISLGLKQTEPDPWLTLDQRFPIGTKLTGKVRNLTNFGAFVEIEEGIDGLVHISDMSWTRRVVHPSEVLKKGDKVDVVVLSIDKDARRISLGLKQVSEDPWPTLAEKYIPDLIVKGNVVRLLDRGVIVDLEEGLEGFIPLSQLGVDGLKKPADSFKVGDEMNLKVTRVDTQAHRIILSVRAWLADQPQPVQAEFQTKFKPNPSAESSGEETVVAEVEETGDAATEF